jgi:hypothetical protein
VEKISKSVINSVSIAMKGESHLLLQVPIELGVKNMINDAVNKTRLGEADVIRSALRLGVPELVKRSEGVWPPRRNFADYLGLFASIKRNRQLVTPSSPWISARFSKPPLRGLRPK